MKSKSFRYLIPFLYLVIAGCAPMPALEDSVREFSERQKQSARTAQEQNRLADALALWRSLEALEGADPEVQAAVVELENRIDQGVARAMRRGTSAYSKGDHATGDLWMLRALALQPANREARSWLAKSESRHAQIQQNEKSHTENQMAVMRQRDSADGINVRLRDLYQRGEYRALVEEARDIRGSPGDEIGSLLRSAHLKLAESAGQAGNREAELSHVQSALAIHPLTDDPLLERAAVLRAAVSDQLYQEGARLIKTDVGAAIAALEKSLHYNPYNSAAKRQLDQARTLQRNLERIQKQH